jgi:GT2 family glycosyltransferase
MKPLFVIMVTYKRFEMFKQTVESLLPTLPKDSRLLVIDNDPEPTTNFNDIYRYCMDDNDSVQFEYLPLEENRGWGAAMNEALNYFPGWKDYEYVLESNNDVIYEPGWFEKSTAMMHTHPDVGILALWKHTAHGEISRDESLIFKDQMPATAWLFRSRDLAKFLPFPENGPTKMRGGIGEDVAFVNSVVSMGYRIAAPVDDLAHHQDGYETGGINPAYE